MVQSRAEPPLQPTPGDEPAYSAFKDVRVILPLCVLAVLVLTTILGTVLYRDHYKSRRERRRRQQSEQSRLEGGLVAAAIPSSSGDAKQVDMTPLLRPDVASVNYAAVAPWSQLEAICEEARHRHQQHHQDEVSESDENVDDDKEREEAYIYNVFAPRPRPQLPSPEQQLQVQLRHYVDRTGQCRTCVRDVLLRRLEGRQRAAAVAAGTVGWRLGGGWCRGMGLGRFARFVGRRFERGAVMVADCDREGGCGVCLCGFMGSVLLRDITGIVPY
ncbi:hypothetical protein PG997_008079 [Apiospora hydei]|uniref:Uncharacterized protein n=1 Tax=Apiospora hydei TaxID=1337664 RepID=A0ABR1W9U3_9PEZI